MRGFLAGGVCFAEKKLIVDPYFQILAFIILVQLTILSKHLLISNQACWNKHSKYIHIIIIIFHLLLYVEKVLSSLIDRERQPIWINFLTLQGKPNSHAWGMKSPMQHFYFLSGSWIRATPLDYRVQLLGTRMLAAWERCAMFKEGESKVHSQVQSGTLAYRLPYFSACD